MDIIESLNDLAKRHLSKDELTTLRQQVIALEARNKELEALAEQPTQEPVAWMHRHAGEITEFNDFQSCQYCEPLYTHPKQWQGLSDEEIKYIVYKYANELDKLREKNT